VNEEGLISARGILIFREEVLLGVVVIEETPLLGKTVQFDLGIVQVFYLQLQIILAAL
jgi:hypothetical protein